MKSSELSNGKNRIVLRQFAKPEITSFMTSKFGFKMEIAKKMARENFSIGAFYNITKNQDNPIKTVGRDSFLSPKPLKYKFFRVTQPPGVAQPLCSRGHN